MQPRRGGVEQALFFPVVAGIGRRGVYRLFCGQCGVPVFGKRERGVRFRAEQVGVQELGAEERFQLPGGFFCGEIFDFVAGLVAVRERDTRPGFQHDRAQVNIFQAVGRSGSGFAERAFEKMPVGAGGSENIEKLVKREHDRVRVARCGP